MDVSPAFGRLISANHDRLHALDSLVSLPILEPRSDDVILLPGGSSTESAEPRGAGIVRSLTVPEDDPAAAWDAHQEHELGLLQTPGTRDEMEQALAAVLEELERHARDVDPAIAQNLMTVTAAKDTSVMEPLRAYNFAPLGTTAMHRVSAAEALNPDYPIGLPAGVQIVPVTEIDPEEAVAAAMSAGQEDPRHRRLTATQLTQEHTERIVRTLITERGTLSTVALRDGRIIGVSLVDIHTPQMTPPPTPVRPLALSLLLWVDPSERGRGIAGRLVKDAHGRIADAHIPWCLTYYPASQPMNGYFWSRMGYRPLTTRWWKFPSRT